MAVRHPSGFIAPVRSGDDGREAVRPIIAVAGEAADARAGIPTHHQSVAVKLDFIASIKASTFLIDGEVVIVRKSDVPSDAGVMRQCCTQDGDDLRDLPLIERKQRLKKLIGKARHAILNI